MYYIDILCICHVYIIHNIRYILYMYIYCIWPIYVSIYWNRTFSSKEVGWAVLCHHDFSRTILCLMFLSRLSSEAPSFRSPSPCLSQGKLITCFIVCALSFPYTILCQYLCLVSTLIYFTTCFILFNCESFKKGTLSHLVLTLRAWHIIET